jgi:putative acetyltransferase
VEAPSGDYTTLSLAPVAVLPPWQNQGIGGRLIREALLQLAAKAVEGVVVMGHPNYYPRFGFVTASDLGLRWGGEYPDEAFMALEFHPGFFAARGGLVRFHPAFDRFVG